MNKTSQLDIGADGANSNITILDVTGLMCPLPVLKTQKALRALKQGDVLHVISTDPMASLDIPHFCKEHGHKLLRQEPQKDAVLYVVEKGPNPVIPAR